MDTGPIKQILGHSRLFTADWFSHVRKNFEVINRGIGPVDSILEIGCHEGLSTCWMLANMLAPTGTMTCIDPWANEPLNAFDYDRPPENRIIEEVFRSNVTKSQQPEQTVEIIADLSFPALAKLITQGRQYDFIYVDGSHDADTVLADACMCFGLLKPNGIMLFDDYLWTDDKDVLRRPKMSVDAFVNMFANRIWISLQNYQLAIQKKPKEQK